MSSRFLLREFIAPPDAMEEPQGYPLWQPDGSTRIAKIPAKLRHLPSEMMYDAQGLQLFEDITQLEEEYYLAACERSILKTHTADIAGAVPDGASVIELGCGSMTKTATILQGLRAAKRRGIQFYAIDIEEQSLRSSLQALMDSEADVEDEYRIKYTGILGTYTQALAFFPKMDCTSRVLLWLGSSIGNLTRDGAAALVREFAQNAMRPGDRFFIGIDKPNEPSVVARAYNDSQGLTAEFGLNMLSHINKVLGAQVFDRTAFEYFAGYNQAAGRHEAYLRSRIRQVIAIPESGRPIDSDVRTVTLEEGELIRYEMSHKYDWDEIQAIARAAGLSAAVSWTDPRNRYLFCLLIREGSAAAAGPPSTV